MTDNETNPVEAAFDVLLYAPLGFALDARELLPKLVERGRQQVTMAKMMGQFVVQQGQAMAGDRLGQAQKQAADALVGLGLWPKPAGAPDASAPGATESPAATPLTTTARAAKRASGSKSSKPINATAATQSTAPAPPVTSLAIPDYDSLSASQVVPRLDGLSGDELEAVRRYESAKRGRKTIVGKIGQLQKSPVQKSPVQKSPVQKSPVEKR